MNLMSISYEIVTYCAYKCRWDRTKQWKILQSFVASCGLIYIHRANLKPIHIHLGRFVGMTAASLRVSWCAECRLVWKKMRASAESSYQWIKMKALGWTSDNWNVIHKIMLQSFLFQFRQGVKKFDFFSSLLLLRGGGGRRRCEKLLGFFIN